MDTTEGKPHGSGPSSASSPPPGRGVQCLSGGHLRLSHAFPESEMNTSDRLNQVHTMHALSEMLVTGRFDQT